MPQVYHGFYEIKNLFYFLKKSIAIIKTWVYTKRGVKKTESSKSTFKGDQK